jgi:tRNA A-37 threonylcarbamoyl transferase component Bud32
MSGDRLMPLGRRYRLLSVVGRGGMGTVWRAYDEMLDRDVAVKEVHLPTRITEGERRVMCRRLLCEARATAALKHPGVVAVHDVIVEEGRPWIVMEFVESRSLTRLVTEGGPLGVRRTAEIGAAVLSVLRTSHAAGILHRDVKPGNVLVCDDGRILLSDFGLAVHNGKGREPADTLLAGIEGSPAYLPPERVNGLPSVEASDLWSLGATLYMAVEGFSPFLRCHALASMVAVLLGDFPRPVKAGPLQAVIEGLLRQNPDERLTAEATAELLQKVIGTVPEPGVTRAAIPRRKVRERVFRGPRVPWTLRGDPPCGSRRVPWRVPALPPWRRVRPGAVVSVAVLAGLAAGTGTWAARWTSIGKSQAVALRPAAGVTAKTVRYHEAGAYSVRVPAGWQAERRGDVMTWKDAESARGLRISPAPGDPLGGLRAEEHGAVAGHRYPGYHRLRLEPVPEVVAGAAEWEFTWRAEGQDAVRHVLCGRAAGYQFCFSAPDPDWTPGQRLYDRILKSFKPEEKD